MSFTIDKVSSETFEMEYIKFGNGDKTLVILPGLSVQSVLPAAALIENQYGVFSQEYTVYLFDRIKDLPPIYTVYDMANDTALALKSLGLRQCCLFGVSQGGMIAMLIAADYPELVCKLALGSTACKVNENGKSVINDWINLAKQGDKEALYLSFGKAVYSKKEFEENREKFSLIAKTVSDEDLRRFIILASGVHGFNAEEKLKSINIPVLAIGDSTDAVLGGEAVNEIACQFKGKSNFKMYMYEGFGHAVYDTAEDYKNRLYSFFGK